MLTVTQASLSSSTHHRWWLDCSSSISLIRIISSASRLADADWSWPLLVMHRSFTTRPAACSKHSREGRIAGEWRCATASTFRSSRPQFLSHGRRRQICVRNVSRDTVVCTHCLRHTFGFNSRCRTFYSVCNQPATQGQLSLSSLRGR